MSIATSHTTEQYGDPPPKGYKCQGCGKELDEHNYILYSIQYQWWVCSGRCMNLLDEMEEADREAKKREKKGVYYFNGEE